MRFLPIFLLATATTAIAAPRDLTQARQLAQQQLSTIIGHEVTLAECPQKAALRGDVNSNQQQLPYYHFTDAESRAFIFISGSDLLPAVIGYGRSDNPAYGPSINAADEELPENLQSWLSYVTEVGEYLESNPAAALAQEAALAQTTQTKVIKPLMSCKWGQSSPFNNQCPVKNNQRSVTGCVATAISQVLYTHQFPKKSTGKVSYTDYGTSVTVNLDGVTYDYDKMLDNYSKNLDTKADDAVAKLCYNVGVVCRMQYDPSGSSATTSFAEKGLYENFGCTRVQDLDRYYYGIDEWNGILQQQLEAGLPVIYSGQSEVGGHAFVLDGMDEKGYYHVNWGWQGSWDGYFDISVLRTEGVGIGASVNNGFSSQQSVMVNVCDPKKALGRYNTINSAYNYYDTSRDKINFSPTGSVSAGSRVSISCKVMNSSPIDANATVGAVLMQGNKEIERKTSNTQVMLDGIDLQISKEGEITYSYYIAEIKMDFTLPSNLSDGTYQLWLCLKDGTTDTWDMVRQTHLTPSYATLKVSGGKYTLSHDSFGMLITAGQWSTNPNPLTTAKSKIYCEVTNTADESMPIFFTIDLSHSTGTTVKDVPCGDEYNEAVTLAPGETRKLEFNVQLSKSGTWKATLYGRQQGVTEAKEIAIASTSFEVTADDTRSADLTLKETLKLKTQEVYNDEDISFELVIANSGEAYNGQLCVRLFKSSTSVAENSLVAEIGPQNVQISGHKASTTIEISGRLHIDGLSKPTKYYARAFYQYGDEMKQLPASYNTENKVAVPVYPGEDTVIDEVKADEMQNNGTSLSPADQIYNLLGKRISFPANGQLRPGIYIINGKKRVIN